MAKKDKGSKVAKPAAAPAVEAEVAKPAKEPKAAKVKGAGKVPGNSRAAAKVAAEGYDYAAYKDKAPTSLHVRFADFVIQKLELTFGSKKEEQAFREGIRLGTALRIPFQASPENQAHRIAQANAPKAPKEPKPAKEKAAKPAGDVVTVDPELEAPVDAETDAPASVKVPKGKKAKVTPEAPVVVDATVVPTTEPEAVPVPVPVPDAEPAPAAPKRAPAKRPTTAKAGAAATSKKAPF